MWHLLDQLVHMYYLHIMQPNKWSLFDLFTFYLMEDNSFTERLETPVSFPTIIWDLNVFFRTCSTCNESYYLEEDNIFEVIFIKECSCHSIKRWCWWQWKWFCWRVLHDCWKSFLHSGETICLGKKTLWRSKGTLLKPLHSFIKESSVLVDLFISVIYCSMLLNNLPRDLLTSIHDSAHKCECMNIPGLVGSDKKRKKKMNYY